MLSIRRTSAIALRTLRAVDTSTRNYSKDYDSSDDEKSPRKTTEPKDAAPAKESAAARLNRLLASMQTQDQYKLETTQNMARPGIANKKRKEVAKQEAANKDIFVAAKRVASLMGDEQTKKQTESELLSKLLGQNQNVTPSNEADEDATKTASKSPENEQLSLSELIVGMKIDRRQQPQVHPTRGEFVRRTLAGKMQQQQRDQTFYPKQRVERKRQAETYTGSVNLFGCEPLGIFKNIADLRESPDMLETWAHLEEHELQMQVTHPPANYFEKIAQWTAQGKVWRFPIDNEQDMIEEAKVDFSEHIFLEQHLEPWCPTKGPVRHFMELVCVGLSKNPYISAKDKKEHILWYRDYFEQKKHILKDLMNNAQMEKVTAAGQKQVDA